MLHNLDNFNWEAGTATGWTVQSFNPGRGTGILSSPNRSVCFLGQPILLFKGFERVGSAEA